MHNNFITSSIIKRLKKQYELLLSLLKLAIDSLYSNSVITSHDYGSIWEDRSHSPTIYNVWSWLICWFSLLSSVFLNTGMLRHWPCIHDEGTNTIAYSYYYDGINWITNVVNDALTNKVYTIGYFNSIWVWHFE